MFNVQAVKGAMRPFDVQKPLNTTALLDDVAQYFEHYGFYDTLKEFDGEYCWGTKTVAVADQSLDVAVHWWSQAPARGTVVLIHGLFDHVGLFQRIIQHFLLHEYNVLAIDLPGHGLSDGAPTDIGSFLEYSAVVSQVIDVLPKSVRDKPVFAVGQSTGGGGVDGGRV